MECLACGLEVTRRPSEIPASGRVFCSVPCRNRYIGTRNYPPSHARKGRTCEACGGTYDATYAEQRTCSRRCGAIINSGPRRVIWPSTRIYFGQCPTCSTWFSTRDPRKTYCTGLCWDRAKRRKAAHPCIKCGKGSLLGARTLCDNCRQQIRAERRYKDKKRRRALIKGATEVERISLSEIAVRDRGVCGLCGKRVAMTKSAPHPKAPSLDHIVPLAEGGQHVKANVQLAHLGCNVRKRDGGQQQLALIG